MDDEFNKQETLMPNSRLIDSDFWTRQSIQKLSFRAKAFYLYLMTNQHINPSGVYRVTEKTMAFDTDMVPSDFPDLFAELEDKVKWYREESLVWVKNFIFHQGKSPQFIQAASKHLTELNLNGVAQEVLKYNADEYKVTIPYPYRKYGVSIGKSEITKLKKDEELTEDQNKEMAIVSRVFEENIGILTPMIADRLKDIVGEYPSGWFKMAAEEAVENNVRNLRYIERILENWQVHGVKKGKGSTQPAKKATKKLTYIEDPK